MKIIESIKAFSIDMISPKNPRCSICKRVLFFERKPFCEPCGNRLTYCDNHSADLYGRIHQLSLKDGVSMFVYDEHSKELIFDFKYHRNKDAAIFCGEQLYLIILKQPWFAHIDLITSVPINKPTLELRGYNQSELITHGIEQKCDIIINNNILSKSDQVSDQTQLDYQQRFENMQHAYQVTKTVDIHSKNILVIDDVITTGATLHTISNELLKAGASNVYYATVATALTNK